MKEFLSKAAEGVTYALIAAVILAVIKVLFDRSKKGIRRQKEKARRQHERFFDAISGGGVLMHIDAQQHVTNSLLRSILYFILAIASMLLAFNAIKSLDFEKPLSQVIWYSSSSLLYLLIALRLVIYAYKHLREADIMQIAIKEAAHKDAQAEQDQERDVSELTQKPDST